MTRLDRFLTADFAVCPHCWHVNGPLARICMRCRADMTLLLQESGGARWTAAVQSPVPVSGGSRLSRAQRIILLGFVLAFGLVQLMYAYSPARPGAGPQPPVRSHPTGTQPPNPSEHSG